MCPPRLFLEHPWKAEPPVASRGAMQGWRNLRHVDVLQRGGAALGHQHPLCRRRADDACVKTGLLYWKMDFPPKHVQGGAPEHSGEPITQPPPPGFCAMWLKEGAHRERNASGDLSRWTEGGASELKLLPAAVLPGWKCQLCCPARVTRWFLALWDEARQEVGWAPVPPGASGISKHSGGPASASRAPGRVKSRPPRRGDAAPAGSPLLVSPSPPPHGARGDCPVPTGKNPVAVRTRKARWGCLDVPWPAGWLMGHPR